MVLFNHATREMTAKIVYYGPGLCGKTTNLLVIYDKLDSQAKGKMLSLATRSDRTLFFDLLPVDLGKVGNFRLKIQLYTVPGQVFYNETRKLVLRGSDAVVFVVDSQRSMVDSNRDSFANLLENLRENHIDADDLPIVIQYNKRDIPGVLPVHELEKALGFEGYTSLEASALKGEGVMETFRLVSRLTAKKLLDRMEGKRFPEPASEEPSQAQDTESGAEPENQKNPADISPAGAGFDRLETVVDHAPFSEDYDGMEEVSLEQLLEGRDRPLTIGLGAPASQDDDIDELSDADLLATPDNSSSVEATQPEQGQDEEDARSEDEPERALPQAADVEPAGQGDLEAEVVELRAELASLRAEYDQLVDAVSSLASDLARLAEKESSQ